MRIIFAGTPEFAAKILKVLLESEHEICAIYTQPDRPAGRGRKLTASPVKQLAIEHNIPTEQPTNFKDNASKNKLATYQADLMIVAAYSLILPQIVLDTPKLGCINIHASLLPRWRGAAPIQRAILAGDSTTGVCIMQMEAELDAGPIMSRQSCPIHADDTSQMLHVRLAHLGANTLLTTLANLTDLQHRAEPQNHALACYAEKLRKEEAQLNWQHSAHTIARQIHAFNPWPVAQTWWQDKIFRIWSATVQNYTTSTISGEILAVNRQGIDVATGNGVLRLTKIQIPGKRTMSVAHFLNANTVEVGDHFG